MKLLLGVCGSVAAYKSLELIRLLNKNECEIKVILTAGGARFIHPLAFLSLGVDKVVQDLWDAENSMAHITLTRWADCFLVAPATAQCLAKTANGNADDLLSSALLAVDEIPIVLAPAMNQAMYKNSATQRNVEQLKADGVQIWGPDSGEQACGEHGEGRMLEPNELHERLQNFF